MGAERGRRCRHQSERDEYRRSVGRERKRGRRRWAGRHGRRRGRWNGRFRRGLRRRGGWREALWKCGRGLGLLGQRLDQWGEGKCRVSESVLWKVCRDAVAVKGLVVRLGVG